MKLSLFSFNSRVALTVDAENQVILWTVDGDKKEVKLFTNENGKALLYADRDWFNCQKQKAAHCEYAQAWFGEFPYSSWCWAIRKSDDGVEVQKIWTSINQLPTDSDKWIASCKAFVPNSSSLVIV